MSTYTWQYGFFQTLIIRIAQIFNENIIYDYSLCLRVLFYTNAILSSISLLFGFLITKTLSDNDNKVKLCYVFLSITCIPFFLYTLYLYSDVPAICLLMIATYFFVLFSKKDKLKYCLVSILFVCFACVIRFSSIVFAIAFMLITFYNSFIENKNLMKGLISFLFIILPIFSNKLPAMYYENVSNYKQVVNDTLQNINDGCPILLNVAMGIDIDARMYGWYTGKNYDTCFNVCDHNLACEVNVASDSIDDSLKIMSNNIDATLDFFFKKLSSEWGDGTMEAFFSTKIVGDTVDRFVVNFLYKGNSNLFLHCYAKAHIILVYLLSLCFVYKNKAYRLSIFKFTLEIIVLGGLYCRFFGKLEKIQFGLCIYYSNNGFFKYKKHVNKWL